MHIKVDDSRYQRALETFVNRFGMSVREVLRQQHRLLVAETAQRLPPKNKKQGVDATTRSLRNAAAPLNQTNWDSPEIKKMIRRQSITEIEAVFQRIPERSGVRVRTWSPSLHKSAKVQGRVKRSKRIAVVPGSQWKRYRTKLAKRVGALRGGILASVSTLGARVPGWLASHAAAGLFVDRSGLKKNPSIESVSRLPYSSAYKWATKGLAQSRMSKALGDLRRRVSRAAKESGL